MQLPLSPLIKHERSVQVSFQAELRGTQRIGGFVINKEDQYKSGVTEVSLQGVRVDLFKKHLNLNYCQLPVFECMCFAHAINKIVNQLQAVLGLVNSPIVASHNSFLSDPRDNMWERHRRILTPKHDFQTVKTIKEEHLEIWLMIWSVWDPEMWS